MGFRLCQPVRPVRPREHKRFQIELDVSAREFSDRQPVHKLLFAIFQHLTVTVTAATSAKYGESGSNWRCTFPLFIKISHALRQLREHYQSLGTCNIVSRSAPACALKGVALYPTEGRFTRAPFMQRASSCNFCVTASFCLQAFPHARVLHVLKGIH